MTMRRWAPLLSVGLLLALAPATALALNSADLDQSCESADLTYSTTMDLAQTFKAGRTGSLDDVELRMGGTGTITASIFATSSGLPTGSALASASATLSGDEVWLDFAFVSPASVTSGTVYAIVFNTGANASIEGGMDAYADGQALHNEGTWVANAPGMLDYAFRTYVSAAAEPTPTIVATPPPTSTVADTASGGAIPALPLLLSLIATGGLLLHSDRVSRRDR
jgi:hypothetical protein